MKKTTLKNRLKLDNDDSMHNVALNFHERIVKRGGKKAVILDLKEFKRLWALAEDAVDFKVFEARKNSPLISHHEFKKLLKEHGRL